MRFLADENFHGDMFRGIIAAYPELDIVRVQDTAFVGAKDEVLLEEAARQGAILLTHDAQTMTKYANDRIKAGLPMPGVILVIEGTPIGQAIADLTVMIGAGTSTDFVHQVRYIPLR
jgi:hypothetical protein